MTEDFYYYRMHYYRWDEGCQELTHEEEVAYLKIVNTIAARGRPIEDEEDMNRALARRARLGWAKWKKVKAALVEKGKITLEDGLIMQRKALQEVDYRNHIRDTKSANARGAGSGDEPKNGEISGKNSENSGKFPENFAGNEGAEAAKNNDLGEAPADKQKQEQDIALLSSASARAKMVATMDRLYEVAGPGLADPTKEPGLALSATEVAKWLQAGCDLEGDIVPVIQARTANARGSPIKSWSYFRGAVLEQAARNKQQLTIPEAPDDQSSSPSARKSHEASGAGRGRARSGSITDICVGLLSEAGETNDGL